MNQKAPSGSTYQLKLQATQYLKGTGLLEGYESVIEKLIVQGWPSDKNIFDHAAYELLKWNSDNKARFENQGLVNPGAAGLQAVDGAPTNFEEDLKERHSVDQDKLRDVEPSKRAANVLEQTRDQYPEVDEAARIQNYRNEV